MEALILKNGRLSLMADAPQPSPAAGEALIRISLAGVCATDLELVKGYAGGFEGILGHEFVGVVEATADPADAAWIGQRVVGTINIADANSPEFAEFGAEHHPRRTVLGIHNRPGIFATYTTLPVRNLLPVPQGVADEAAVFTEPLAAALRIADQVRVRPSARVAVVGPGRLGMLIGKVLSLNGAAVQMLGRRPDSLALPQAWGLATGLAEAAESDSFDFVVEATGNAAGFEQSLRLVRPQGTLILKSTFASDATLNLTKLVVAEITVVGSRCGPFAPALRLLQQGAVDVGSLIESEYPLRDGQRAFEHAAQPGVRKILLRP